MRKDELVSLEKSLRQMKIPHWSLTQYARFRQGAPDLLLPQLRLAIWLMGHEVSPRQEREQAILRAMGWKVLLLETAHAAMVIINKAKGI